jgi:FkbM family methyltransferase
MASNIASWLTREPPESLLPTYDRCILTILRARYLFFRMLFRLCLGKRRRERSKFFRSIYVGNYTIPSFGLIKFLYRSMKYLKLGNPTLLKVYANDHGYKYHCKLEDFNPAREEDIIKLFRPKEGDVVIDVGAHIGKYTILASKMVGSAGKVIAIEAHPANYDILNKNIVLNKLSNVVTLNYAVHSKEDIVKLYEAAPAHEEGFTIYNTIMSDRETVNNQKYIEVKANTLDSLMLANGINQVNWIKVDVEGAEFEVLKGSTSVLSSSKDISILLEVHNVGDKKKTFYEPIMTLLRSNNFRIFFERIHESGERHIIVKKTPTGPDRVESTDFVNDA